MRESNLFTLPDFFLLFSVLQVKTYSEIKCECNNYWNNYTSVSDGMLTSTVNARECMVGHTLLYGHVFFIVIKMVGGILSEQVGISFFFMYHIPVTHIYVFSTYTSMHTFWISPYIIWKKLYFVIDSHRFGVW